MIKQALIQMSYDVSDTEKNKAETALLYFNGALKSLKLASDHLNIMKTPFKDNPEINEDSVIEARAAMRRFRDKVIDNFNNFKTISFKCVHIMQNFSSDTQVIKLMKTFISAVDALEVKVNDFADLFNDLHSKDLIAKIVEYIDNIQQECDSIDEIIDERIKRHIQTNILAKSWVDSVSNDLQMVLEQKEPLIVELFNKRQDQLNQYLKDKK